MRTLVLLAAAAAAVAAMALPAAAQNVHETYIISGAVKDAANAGSGQDAVDRTTPELPVVYEDAGQ